MPSPPSRSIQNARGDPGSNAQSPFPFNSICKGGSRIKSPTPLSRSIQSHSIGGGAWPTSSNADGGLHSRRTDLARKTMGCLCAFPLSAQPVPGPALVVSSLDGQTWRSLIQPVELILVKFGHQSCSLTGLPPGTGWRESGKTQGRPHVFSLGAVRDEREPPSAFDFFGQTGGPNSKLKGDAGSNAPSPFPVQCKMQGGYRIKCPLPLPIQSQMKGGSQIKSPTPLSRSIQSHSTGG